MTIWYSDLVDSTKSTGGRATVFLGSQNGVVSFPSGSTLATSDSIYLFFVSANTRLYDLHLDISGALDPGTALTADLTDGTDAYFLNASKVNANGDTLQTILRAGGRGQLAQMGEAGMFCVKDYTQDTVMRLAVTAGGGAMAAARTIKFSAYTQQQ